MLTFQYGEEDDLGPTNDVFKRHIADLTENPAVGRVVPVVAHHEIMPLRHLVDGRVVVEAIIHQIESGVAYPVGERLAPALDTRGASPLLGLDEVLDALASDGFPV